MFRSTSGDGMSGTAVTPIRARIERVRRRHAEWREWGRLLSGAGPAPAMPAPPPADRLRTQMLVLQPTPFCNVDCDYCYLPDRSSPKRMSLEVVDRTLERLREADLIDGPLTVLWHAGEPLVVSRDFYEEAFARIARDPRVARAATHTFQTNGTLIDAEWCAFFARHRVDVGVSIDGPAFLHDAHRKTRSGKGTHAAAVRGARLLREHGVPFGVVAVVTEQALDHADAIYDHVRELGAEGLGLNIEEVEGANASSTLRSDHVERVRAFFARLLERNRESAAPLTIRELDTARGYLLDPRRTTAGPGGVHPNLETRPLAMINVDCDGNFSTFSPELLGQSAAPYGSFTLGNVRDTSFLEALRSPRFAAIDADLRAGNARCAAECPFWDLCGGASPSNKLFENGGFDSTETLHCRCVIQLPHEVVLEDLERSLRVE